MRPAPILTLVALLSLTTSHCYPPVNPIKPGCHFCSSIDIEVLPWSTLEQSGGALLGQRVAVAGIADIAAGMEMRLLNENQKGPSGVAIDIAPRAFKGFGINENNALMQCHGKRVVAVGTYTKTADRLPLGDGRFAIIDSGDLDDIICIKSYP